MEDQSNAYVLGKIIGALLIYLALAYPTMAVLNWLLAPSFLGFVFGGYLTFWKTYALVMIVKALF